jgi:hypothetical protein
VRALCNSRAGLRLAVHFEYEDLKPALVKPANLRIVFEFPSEEQLICAALFFSTPKFTFLDRTSEITNDK